MQEDKTIFKLEHAQKIYQTIVDILNEKYSVKITVRVNEKRDISDSKKNEF